MPFVGDEIGRPAVIDSDGRQTLIRCRERVAFITTDQLRAVMDESLAGWIRLFQCCWLVLEACLCLSLSLTFKGNEMTIKLSGIPDGWVCNTGDVGPQ